MLTQFMWNFDSICDREQDNGDKNLVCSMITRSENATLRRNSISTEAILCYDCDQQECQDIIFCEFFSMWSGTQTQSVCVW